MFAFGERPVLHIILLFLLAALLDGASSWDVAVTVGSEIDFIMRNGDITNKIVITNATNLVGMAYDDNSNTMFLSDAKNLELFIFSVNLSQKNITLTPILKRDVSELLALDMAFDSRTRTLYWTNGQAVTKIHVSAKEAPGKPVPLHKTGSPRGIALDLCNRHIYWTNTNRSSPSIMRSNLDGSEVKAIITNDLYEPTSIAVDPLSGKLYWIDDEEGIHFKLEESNLDGSERRHRIHDKHQQPLDLAIDRHSLYWTDYVYNSIWEFDKSADLGVEPLSLTSFVDPEKLDNVRSILVKENLGSTVNCKASAPIGQRTKLLPGVSRSSFKAPGNLTSSNGLERCLNGGELQTNGVSCRCKSGYSGSRCEISSCHNYCLMGECYVDNEGMPVCKCSKSYSGSRCEYDVCNGYCLNNGRCFVNDGNPACECKYFSGQRCEVSFGMSEICALYCINSQLELTSIDTTSCRCTEFNEPFNCRILVSLLSGFIGMLTIIMVFLSVYVSKLRRRPRIKKRFVVNKSGITPLTSRPSQMSGDQCEITIENCCNMNICETPCFEPKLRSSNTRTNNVKKEEKSGLLDHMEGGGNLC